MSDGMGYSTLTLFIIHDFLCIPLLSSLFLTWEQYHFCSTRNTITNCKINGQSILHYTSHNIWDSYRQ